MTILQPRSGSDSVNTGLTALPKACICIVEQVMLRAWDSRLEQSHDCHVTKTNVCALNIMSGLVLAGWLGGAAGQAGWGGDRTQYPATQTSVYATLTNTSPTLKPFRPLDTAGGLTTDWICAASHERIHRQSCNEMASYGSRASVQTIHKVRSICVRRASGCLAAPRAAACWRWRR